MKVKTVGKRKGKGGVDFNLREASIETCICSYIELK